MIKMSKNKKIFFTVFLVIISIVAGIYFKKYKDKQSDARIYRFWVREVELSHYARCMGFKSAIDTDHYYDPYYIDERNIMMEVGYVNSCLSDGHFWNLSFSSEKLIDAYTCFYKGDDSLEYYLKLFSNVQKRYYDSYTLNNRFYDYDHFVSCLSKKIAKRYPGKNEYTVSIEILEEMINEMVEGNEDK